VGQDSSDEITNRHPSYVRKAEEDFYIQYYKLKNEGVNNLSKEVLCDPHIALFGDEETYRLVFDSLKNISFYEALFEVPEELIELIRPLLSTIQHEKYEFKRIYDTQIFILKIERAREF
jgi:hypothetical protein